MGYWNSRGLRGSGLEDMINFTNEIYRKRGIALFQKIPTPITPVQVNNKERTITLAYFEKQSTVDYIGIAQGIALCFDAKETALKNLPIQNIHEHQIEFMEDFQKQGGVSFLLVNFTAEAACYLLPFEVLKVHWASAQNGGRKSIPRSAFETQYLINIHNGSLNYLDALNVYLEKAKTV